MTHDSISTLTENLFALNEPWRGRFLTLLANRARGWPEGRLPSREQVVDWLHNLDIYLEFDQMLAAWHGTRM